MLVKTSAEMVNEAKEKIENLSVEEVAAEMDKGDVLLVDLRESDELQVHGVIPGAVYVPRGILEFLADPTSSYHRSEFNPTGRVILHCAVGARSALAADTLQQMGYTNVAHLDGGMIAWKKAGQPIEQLSS